jgi:hypothetical protein
MHGGTSSCAVSCRVIRDRRPFRKHTAMPSPLHSHLRNFQRARWRVHMTRLRASARNTFRAKEAPLVDGRRRSAAKAIAAARRMSPRKWIKPMQLLVPSTQLLSAQTIMRRRSLLSAQNWLRIDNRPGLPGPNICIFRLSLQP